MGFGLGKLEHKTRIIGYWLLAGGFTTLYFEWYTIAYIIVGLALLTETISYIFHFFEKKTMNSIRHKR